MTAEYCAQVLHISAPDHLDHTALKVETSAFCNPDYESGKESSFRILQDVDVYINSCLSLERKGFRPQELARRRPGLVNVDFPAWGKSVP